MHVNARDFASCPLLSPCLEIVSTACVVQNYTADTINYSSPLSRADFEDAMKKYDIREYGIMPAFEAPAAQHRRACMQTSGMLQCHCLCCYHAATQEANNLQMMLAQEP